MIELILHGCSGQLFLLRASAVSWIATRTAQREIAFFRQRLQLLGALTLGARLGTSDQGCGIFHPLLMAEVIVGHLIQGCGTTCSTTGRSA
ncbi:hypothetical protein XB05_04190 [Xanthomonas arboricola]|uniref:hypothetical protein n=1 Tax=Xanthomonas arboricola TaxID=56448 RepID=UPI00061A0E4B|nr:hypothetical protein [Xanthomonas arboricola]AKC78032.1 hypothetical protein XB05_04190 [Xanthomonas arboricola]